MDIGGWLRRLGLEQYETTFRENEIDDSVLPSLTAEDLKDLGVGLVGHRRKLLDAIAALRAEASAQTPLSDAPATEKEAGDTAERRQVTVMFTDLVGSTALSARMDPEDLREVISTYQRCVADTVRRFGGFVAKYMGDGVLIYFGYPAAHEDDAERALRAGLALIDAVATLAVPEPLQVRIGAATGLVVVGDLIGSGEAQERGIVGETPNLAARLEGIAEPNTIVIAEATRRLVGNLFDLGDLGPKELKGITGPVKAFAVLRASSVESRFEAMHPGGMTELVGREEELGLLLRRWTKAKNGEGQVVLLSGEAGIGKSRLSAALIEDITAEPHTQVRYFCSPQHTDSAFYPIIGQFERAAGFSHGDTPQAKLDKLDSLLAQTSTSRQDGALLAGMLSLPDDGRYPAPDLAPERRRQKTMEALGTQLESLAGSSPVLLIFEDAHWSDPTSLETLGLLVEWVASLRVLMIVTFRPEFEAPWVGQPHVTVLALNRLGHRDIRNMIDRVVGDMLLPADIRNEIIDRTDGIPLFVEEMTKAVLEARSELDALHATAAVPSPALAVPASLHASLMARLDRLGPAKELAQIGAAIGREFSHALLAAAMRKPEQELALLLGRLVGAGLLFLKGVPPHATYQFKHALVQDAAYASLVRGRRQYLHGRIAQALEREFPEVVANEPETLAYHYTEAGLSEPALGYWLKAGQRAAERSADREAIRHLRRGLNLLKTLPDTPERDRCELDFQIALGTPLASVGGYTSSDVGATSERATILAEKVGDVARLFVSLYGQYTYLYITGKTRKALDVARRLEVLGTSQNDIVMQMMAHRALGVALDQIGEFGSGRSHFEKALALYEPEHHGTLAARFLTDPFASTSALLSIVLWISGYPDRAERMLMQAMRQAASLNHVHTSGLVRNFAAQLDLLGGKPTGVLAHTQVMKTLAAEHGVAAWRNYTANLEGWAIARTKSPEEGIALMHEGIAGHDAKGTAYHVALYAALLAEAHACAGDIQSALTVCADALGRALQTEEQYWEAELHRIDGEIRILASRSPVEIEDCFRRALEVSRRQGARMFELRAATALARLWGGQGRNVEAHDLLASVYSWFTEGFETLDLKEAKAILAELK